MARISSRRSMKPAICAQTSGSIRTQSSGMTPTCSLNQFIDTAYGNGKFSVKDRCRFIGHARTAALQAAATLDVLALRHATKSRQDVTHGKGLLADVVRMLVAWERCLEEK